jgi:hypothetical protein
MARIQTLADRMYMDVPTLVRVLASAQLVQMEMLTVNAGKYAGQDEQQTEATMDAEAEDLFPEMNGARK